MVKEMKVKSMTRSTKIYFIAILCITVVCFIMGIIIRNSYTGYDTFEKMEKTENLQQYNICLRDAEDYDTFNTSVKNYSDLEKTSDLVAKVSATNERKMFPYTTTKTKVVIKEVFKGEAKTGQQIFIYEPVNFSYSVSKSYNSTGGYQIMKEGEEYYVFLQKLKASEGYKMSDDEKNSYLPSTASYSKFSVKKGDLKIVDGKKLDNCGYNYGEIQNLEIITSKRKNLLQYKKLKKEVLEKVQKRYSQTDVISLRDV